jgi:hypothetical protein
MRRILFPLALAAAFAGGLRLARGADGDDAIRKLAEHQAKLAGDLRKIEQAAKDIVEIRKDRESGRFVLNAEERKLEREGREDFHIFMERFRNDTLEVLRILDRAGGKEEFVEPLRRVYGDALDVAIPVEWEDEDFEAVVGELGEKFGVRINVSGEVDDRKTVSLSGQMSLLAVLLQLENIYDGKFVVRDGHLWFALSAPPEEPKKDEGKKPEPPKKGK